MLAELASINNPLRREEIILSFTLEKKFTIDHQINLLAE
jgi:hypothetical protein